MSYSNIARRLMNLLKPKTLIYAGAAGLDDNEARAVVIVNIMTVIPALLAVILAPILFFLLGKQWLLLFSPIIEALILFSVPVLNYMGYRMAGKLIMFLTHCIATIFFGFVLGPTANVELIVVFLLGLSFLMFSTVFQRILSIIIILSVLSVLGSYYQYDIPRMLILLAVILINILVFYFYSAHFTKAINTMRDYSEGLQRKTERLEDVNRTKSLHFNTTNHETRSQLNIVATVTRELMAAVKEGGNVVISAVKVNALAIACRKMMLIVNNVLDYSTLENGKFAVVNVPFELRSWISDVIQSFGVLADEKNITIHQDYAANLPVNIEADEKEMEVIVNNLISNALKFSRKDSQVLLSVTRERDNLIIAVTDSGAGMSDFERDHIFDAYATKKTAKHRGTGLGLTLVKKTVESLGGSISVKSRLHLGSTFTVTFPFTEVKQAPVAESQSLRGKTALVVDDDEMNLRAAKTLLVDLDCRVMSAGNLSEALENIRVTMPDLILLDLTLPDGSGKEVLYAIAAAANGVPIITVTGEDNQIIREQMLEAGAKAYILKPLMPRTFTSTILSVFK